MHPNETILEKYRVLQFLGKGTFAEVYQVRHTRLGVERALKVLRWEENGLGRAGYEDFQAQFKLEAQLGAAINHPNVVRVYDLEFDGQTMILVMEYCPGGSLADKMAALQPGELLSIQQGVQIGLDLAQGLAALHAKDAVHRDLKPNNILFDDQGLAKVADLGLAQVPGGPSLRSQLSNPGLHPGTAGFMSPEQATTTTYLNSSSDIYALGLVLFWAITRRSYLNLRPGTRLSSLRPDTPAGLDDLLTRMLAKDPNERPFDGAEAAELLRKELPSKLAESSASSPKADRELGKQNPLERSLGGYLRQNESELSSITVKRVAEEVERHQTGIEELHHVRRNVVNVLRHRWNQLETLRVVNEREAAAEQKRKAEETKASSKAAEAQNKERDGVVHLAPGVGMEFVRVPAGEFTMGSYVSSSEPAMILEKILGGASVGRQFSNKFLDEFWISKNPVTNAQYAIFLKVSGRQAPKHFQNGHPPVGKENHPVVSVNWKDADAFCTWASQTSSMKIRLPTEDEWEKAARGNDGRKYPWGNEGPDTKRCNYKGSVGDTTPFGQYSPQGDSPYGCVDMAGNVWEWVADWYGETDHRQSHVTNPTGQTYGSMRVLRGGSFESYDVSVCDNNRNRHDPADSDNDIGFRCAASDWS